VKDARGHSISHPAAHEGGPRRRCVAVFYVRRDRRSDTRTLTRYLTNISCLRLDFVDRLVGKRYMGGSVRRRKAIAVRWLVEPRGARLHDARPTWGGREGAEASFFINDDRGERIRVSLGPWAFVRVGEKAAVGVSPYGRSLWSPLLCARGPMGPATQRAWASVPAGGPLPGVSDKYSYHPRGVRVAYHHWSKQSRRAGDAPRGRRLANAARDVHVLRHTWR